MGLYRLGTKVLPWVVGTLVVIGLAASLSRYLLPHELHMSIAVILYGPYATEQLPVLAKSPAIEFIHRVGGSFYMLIGVTQFMPRLRARHRTLHRWLGRVFIALTASAGVTAVIMVLAFPYSGVAERIPTLLFSAIFAYSGVRAYLHARRREIAEHREWVIRSFSIGLGIATIRVAYLTMLYTLNLDKLDLLVSAFWVGWVLSLLVAEIWINTTRRQAAHIAPAATVGST